MNQFVKSLLAVGITSALSISLISNVSAATYEIVDTGEVSKLKYTYAQHQNSAGDMAISGTSLYNFPVQFDYLDNDDFDDIEAYVLNSYLSVNGLEDIEDSVALRAGNPTANDLAWVVIWLKNSKGLNIEYQKVGDSIPMTRIGGVTTDYNLWDVTFEGTDTLTRSTVDVVSGITDSGISYGTATAPYLPSESHTDTDGVDKTFWLKEHGLRGFFSYDLGAQIFQVPPFETVYIGGVSAVLDVNEAGVAVGFSSYKVNESFDDLIASTSIGSGDCNNSDVVPGKMTLEACIAEKELRSSIEIYHNMAFKTTLDPNGVPVVEQLGLLITPHPDDIRIYSSYALAINNQGIAVGYADGFNDETVITPAKDEKRAYHYAVVYKNDEVIDLTGDHTDMLSSRAYDINDTGIAVGHIGKVISGKAVNKFFYVDTNVSKEEINLVNPDDFFNGSDSTARAINNSGLIVGEGEIETHNDSSSNPRRTAAFVYNMNDDNFANINELIPCNIRQSYDIIEARGINDAGVISATAVVKTDRRNAKGEVMLDSSGTPLREDVVRAISLNPIPDTGEVCTQEEAGLVERQGASISFGSAWLLVAILGLRRKFFN